MADLSDKKTVKKPVKMHEIARVMDCKARGMKHWEIAFATRMPKGRVAHIIYHYSQMAT